MFKYCLPPPPLAIGSGAFGTIFGVVQCWRLLPEEQKTIEERRQTNWLYAKEYSDWHAFDLLQELRAGYRFLQPGRLSLKAT